VTPGSVAASLGGLALFAAPGWGLTTLCRPLRRRGWVVRLTYAYLLGIATVAGSLFAASHLLGVPLRRPAIAAAILVPCLLGVLGWAHRRQTAAAPEAKRPRPPAWLLAMGLLIAAIVAGPLAHAVSTPLYDWDGRETWNVAAGYFRDEGTVDAAVLTDVRWFVSNPRYPPLLPLAQVVVQETFGAADGEELFTVLYVGFYAAALALIFAGARRVAGVLPAQLAALCAAATPLLRFGDGGATSTYSDLPLGAFYGAGLGLLLLERPTLASGCAAGCMLAATALAKSEGELLAGAAVLLAGWRLYERRGRPAVARARTRWFLAVVLPVAAAIALVSNWRASIPGREDDVYFTNLTLQTFVAGAVGRLPRIVPEAARLTSSWYAWHGFWVLFLVTILAAWPGVRRRRTWLMLAAGLVPLVVGYGAYAVSERYFRLIFETWNRLLIQSLIPLTIAFAAALAHALRQIRRPSGPPRADTPAATPETPERASPPAPPAPAPV
jgi:hypothetical protein